MTLLLAGIGTVAVCLPKLVPMKRPEKRWPGMVYGPYFGAILAASGFTALAPNLLIVRMLYYFLPLTLFFICCIIDGSTLRGPLRASFFVANLGVAVLYWGTASSRVIQALVGS